MARSARKAASVRQKRAPAVREESKMTVGQDVVAHDFVKSIQGKLDPDKISAIIQQVLTANTRYPTSNGSVICAFFYMRFTVDCQGKAFIGNAGGIGTVGGGALLGDIYTDDINRLFSSTTAFQFNMTPVYTSLIFFDGHSNALGTFQAGAVSTCAGTGGGSGSWS